MDRELRWLLVRRAITGVIAIVRISAEENRHERILLEMIAMPRVESTITG